MSDGQAESLRGLAGEPRQPRAAAAAPLSPRSLVLGFLLVAAFTTVGIFSVLLRYEIVGTGYLPRGGVFLLLLLVLGNAAVRKLAPRRALRQEELALIFALLLVMAALPGQEFSQHVYLNLLGVVYYATPDIAPPELYLDVLPSGLVPALDRGAPVIRWAFEGKPPGAAVPYGAWLGPLGAWTVFWLALYWTLACWAVLFFPRWQEHEKLVFPLVQVPLELAQGFPHRVPAVLSNRLFWLGFGFSSLLYLVKGLHSYFPAVPDFNLQKDLGQVFSGGPGVVYNYLPLHFYPEMVGIAFLLSAEVGFSVWFFYHFQLLEKFVRFAVGLRENPAPFLEAQTVGGYLVLGLALLGSARAYLGVVAQRALGSKAGQGVCLPGEREGHPYRLAWWGFWAGAGFLLLWCRGTGMRVGWAALQWLGFPLVTLVVARVVCEAGMFIYSSPFRLNEVIVELVGPKALGRRDLAMLFLTSWAEVRSTATQNAAYWFQALKLVAAHKLQRGQFLLAGLGAIAVAMVISHWLSLYVIYTWSVPKLGWWPRGSALNTTRTLAQYLRNPLHYGPGEWAGLAGGALFTAFLVHMRQRFTWWPFHPLGFVTWLGWPTERYWLSMALGWLWKVATVRFFGFKAFAALRPLAFGLIAGLCFILSCFLIIHMFWPGPPLLIE
jgi:hypothetical protein